MRGWRWRWRQRRRQRTLGWIKNYEEPGPHGSAADFLLGEEMEGDPSGREEVEVAAIKPASHSPQHH